MNEIEQTELLRDALLHLHETAYLRVHPLASLLAGNIPTESRGKAVRTRLLTLIEQLRPPDDTPTHALAWRSYRYIKLRYVESLEHAQVASELGVTERHGQRVRHEALAALRELLPSPPHSADAPSTATEPSTDSGSLESELSRVDATSEPPIGLTEGVRSVLDTLAAVADLAGTSVTLVAHHGADTPVDRTTLRQVMINLMSFAIRQWPRLSITVATAGMPPRVEISVTVAFDVSASGESPLDDDEHLQTARRIGELRGSIVTLSRDGNGVRIGFVLEDLTPRPKRVLLIDDNPDFLLLYRRFLESGGYLVNTASDTTEAIRLAQEETPDVITLDVLMPKQDGWEILQRLKNQRQTRAVPVIVCSVIRDQDLALSLGASAFLPKPVNQSSFLKAIDLACGRHR